MERKLGLWVDRIGSASSQSMPDSLRVLGLYGAVHVCRGAGRFVSPETGELSVQSGDTIMLFPETPTRYGTDASWETLWVVWGGDDAAQLVECGYATPGRPVLPDSAGATRATHARLANLMQREDSPAILERKIAILEMIHRLQGAHSAAPPVSDNVIAEAVVWLNAHSAEPFSINDVAHRFGASPTHFRRRFRACTGRGPREFVTGLRIARAKALLSQGMPMKQVALRTGFPDVFYFMRVFKKVTGVPPGRFTAMGR